jgi:hypothetical protein
VDAFTTTTGVTKKGGTALSDDDVNNDDAQRGTHALCHNGSPHVNQVLPRARVGRRRGVGVERRDVRDHRTKRKPHKTVVLAQDRQPVLPLGVA